MRRGVVNGPLSMVHVPRILQRRRPATSPNDSGLHLAVRFADHAMQHARYSPQLSPTRSSHNEQGPDFVKITLLQFVLHLLGHERVPCTHAQTNNMATPITGAAFGAAMMAAGFYDPAVVLAQLKFDNWHMFQAFLAATASSAYASYTNGSLQRSC